MKRQKVNLNAYLQVHEHALDILQQVPDLGQPLPILKRLDTRHIAVPAALGAELAVAECPGDLSIDPVPKFPCSVDEALRVLAQLHRKWPSGVGSSAHHRDALIDCCLPLLRVAFLWNVRILLSLSLVFFIFIFLTESLWVGLWSKISGVF